MLKLSVIVPVYNVAPYLRKCVDSLCRQGLQTYEYEIILVDDGSTDECPRMCDDYAATHENIRVLHQPNGGLSAARNTGIAAAKGQYVQFVDSDDYLEPDVLAALVAQCEREDLDVLRFDYQNVRINPVGEYEVFQPNKYPHKVDNQTDVTDGETYLNERMGYACYAVMFLVRRTLLDETLLFTTGIHFEDVDWTPRMLLAAKRVNATQKVVYNYLVREGSITQVGGNKDKKRKNLEDSMLIVERLGALLAQHSDCRWLRDMQSNTACGVLTTVARQFYSERGVYISRLKALHVFPLSLSDQGKTYLRRARMINILGAKMYCWMFGKL